jgi:glutathione S-transferase
MTDLVLFTNPHSRGRTARWMLEEVGAPYKAVVLPYGAPMRTPGFLAIKPMGKVPALRHGAQVVTECAAICAYLADAFPAAGLAPPPDRRAAYYRWLFFAAGPAEAAMTNRALGVEVPPEKAGFVGYGSWDRVLDALETAVASSAFIASDSFSAADVYVGGMIGWGLAFGSIKDRPVLADYWKRIADRPARSRAAEHEEADQAELETS